MKTLSFALVVLLAGCASSPAPVSVRATDACGGARAPNEICVPPVGTVEAAAVEVAPPEKDPEPKMVAIPMGTFEMGSDDGEGDERPVHTVKVQAFEMDLTEVTVRQYRACVAKGRCSSVLANVEWVGMTEDTRALHRTFCNGPRDERLDHPINCVSFDQAESFCRFVGKRLPTEEEWEYAARGPKGLRYPWGDKEPGPTLLNGCGEECVALGQKHGEAWTASYPGGDSFASTAPVGSFPAGKSPFGVLDLAGNVWEWTGSPHCDYDTQECNQSQRISRGGGWSGDTAYNSNHRATYRGYGSLDERSDSLGFRCAR